MNKIEILAALAALRETAEKESRSFSAEELVQFEALESQLEAANKTEAAISRHARYIAPQGLVLPDADNKPADGEIDPAKRAAFASWLRTGRASGEFLSFAQSEGTPGEGGYTVPDGAMRPLILTRKAFGGIAALAETIVTSDGRPIPWPTADDTASVGEIVAEGAAAATSGADLVFGTKSLGAYKYVATGKDNEPLRVSFELLADANFDIAAFVEARLSERIARRQALDWANGTGSGQPQGLDRVIPSVNTATANPITYAKLNALVHKLDPEYRPAAKFLMNDNTAAAIEQLVDSTGRPILLPSAAASISAGVGTGAAGFTLLGYPVVIDQGLPDVANAGDTMPGLAGDGFVAFGDIAAAYIIRYVKGTTIIVDPYSRAKYGQMTYHAWARADGMIQDTNAVVTLGGFHA